MNKVQLIGNVGRDPDIRYTPGGSAVCKLAIATNEYRNDRETGERKEHTEWHDAIFFGRAAETIAQYVRKGTRIYVEGPLRKRKYQNGREENRLAVEVHVREFEFLGGKGAAGDAPRGNRDTRSRARPASRADAGEPDYPF